MIHNQESHELEEQLAADAQPDMSMFHRASTHHGKSGDVAGVAATYDRSLEGYEGAINAPLPEGEEIFSIKDWKHKTILDIGSGAHDRFGFEARAKGVRVISVNPALQHLGDRLLLEDGTEIANKQRFDKWVGRYSVFGAVAHAVRKSPESESVAAVGQNLPFRDDTFDGVVSVFGVPNYLHHVDEPYSPEVREKDKLLIARAFDEIVRVLKPGGKAYLTDKHADLKMRRFERAFSESDGTEVLEVLDALRERGISSQVYDNTEDLSSAFDPAVRTVVITKPALQ